MDDALDHFTTLTSTPHTPRTATINREVDVEENTSLSNNMNASFDDQDDDDDDDIDSEDERNALASDLDDDDEDDGEDYFSDAREHQGRRSDEEGVGDEDDDGEE